MPFFSTLPILGADEPEFGIFKVIVPIILAVFWVAAQILSSIGKKKPQTPPAEQPVSLPPQAPVPQRQPKQQRQVKHRVETRQQQRQRSQQRAVPPPLQPPARVKVAQQQAADAIQSITQSDRVAVDRRIVAQQGQTSAASRRLHETLRPKNLRQAYILTEILQPPVGMRRDPL